MEAANIPVKMPVVWGQNAGAGFIRTVPVPSQIGINAGYASFTDGFVPLNFVNPNAGGVPPWGQDFNGALNTMTAWSQWQQAGAPIYYDATFSAAIGGYPKYALIASNSTPGAWWQSQVDDNLSNPDAGGANWILCTMSSSYLNAHYLRFPTTTTFYVNPSVGSDTLYDGTSATIVPSTSHGPWATIAHAVGAIGSSFFYTGTITLFLASGTYPATNFGASGIGSWKVVGAGGPGNPYTTGTTLFSASAGQSAIGASATVLAVFNCSATGPGFLFFANSASSMTLSNCKAIGTGSGSAAYVSNASSYLALYGGAVFGTTTSTTFQASGTFGEIFVGGDGGTCAMGYNDGTTRVIANFTFGATTVTGAVALGESSGLVVFTVGSVTWAGSTPSGLRYEAVVGGGIAAGGGGVNFIPGTVAGIAAASTTITTATGYIGGYYSA